MKSAMQPRLKSTTLQIQLQKEKTKKIAKVLNKRLEGLSTTSLNQEYQMLQKNENIQPSSRLLNAVKRHMDGGLVSPDSLDSLDKGKKHAIGKIFSSLQVTGE